jgi:hypothetical protein
MTTVANGRCTSAPAPTLNAIGKKPSEAHERGHQHRAQATERTIYCRLIQRPAVIEKLTDEDDHDEAVEDGDAREHDKLDRKSKRECRASLKAATPPVSGSREAMRFQACLECFRFCFCRVQFLYREGCSVCLCASAQNGLLG